MNTTREKSMENDSYTTTAWFVIASLCDCGHVASTVMNAAIVADTTPSNSATEITATGDDWRALVTEAATTLARRTGRRVSGSCTAVYVRDEAERQVLQNELVTHVYRLADHLAEQPTLST